MPGNVLPPIDADQKVLDNYYKIYREHLTKAVKGLDELYKELETELQQAQQRQAQVKAVNQKKWFMKLRGSVSEALKSKCVPRNTLSINLIKKDMNQTLRWYNKLKPIDKTGNYYTQLGNDPKHAQARYGLLKSFIMQFIEEGLSVEHYLQTVRDELKKVLEHEKEAFDGLMTYVNQKKDLASPEDLKQFKADWQKIVKTMD